VALSRVVPRDCPFEPSSWTSGGSQRVLSFESAKTSYSSLMHEEGAFFIESVNLQCPRQNLRFRGAQPLRPPLQRSTYLSFDTKSPHQANDVAPGPAFCCSPSGKAQALPGNAKKCSQWLSYQVTLFVDSRLTFPPHFSSFLFKYHHH
jgi:hypothetical protein